jgi:hypothetical protein
MISAAFDRQFIVLACAGVGPYGPPIRQVASSLKKAYTQTYGQDED